MKEAFINKVITVDSCLADSTQTAEGIQDQTFNGSSNRNRYSVAMLGLALSVGASGLLLGVGSQKAWAENATAGENLPTKGTELKEPTLIPSKPQEIAVISPVIKHEVKEGESLWQLAQTYRIAPSAIASENNLSPQSNLEVGQTITIPSLEESSPVKPEVHNRETQDGSLDNLRDTRKRLQESLVALRSQQEAQQQNPSAAVIVIDKPAEDAQSLSSSAPGNFQEESPSPQSDISLSRLDQPVPIVVPTPENNSEQSPYQVPVEVTPVSPEQGNQSSPQQPVAVRQPVLVPPLAEPRLVTPKPERKFHKVQPGDTLNNIARRYGINASELAKANQIDNRNLIKINQQLVVPIKPSVRLANSNKSMTLSTPIAARPPLNSNTAGVETFSIPVKTEPPSWQPSTQAYADKLRSDVQQLRATYQEQNNQAVPIPVSAPVNESPVVGQVPENPQWDRNDRPKYSNINSIGEKTDREQIISAAPTNVEDYNDRLKIPVGTSVEPQLPPLNNPGEHLPDNAPVFNGYIWPAKGVLTSGFGYRWGRPHRGIDIAAPTGTPIVAAAGGEVVSAGWNSGGFGNLVKIRHDDGSITFYAHNSRILVRRGQLVQQGQQISEMGSTGFSTGPHLHFEVHPGGSGAVNPMAFLPKSRS
ncbi:MAG: hypothetical protein N5P05_001797 [Chroococcopsis gigantea SAG 12.99]|nr:hypothetical protein [Chroococcopsis gigantea SAG 12.99]